MAAKTPYRKVLILGFDGLDPNRVRDMVRKGQLPAFAQLQKIGRLCDLATSNPAESPVAWSSLATGCNPGKHGIFDFIHRNPSGYIPYLSLLREGKGSVRDGSGNRFVSPREVPGFWQLTSEAGIPTTVVRWPASFPAESVKGNFLAGLGVPDVLGRLGKYTFYTTAENVTKDEKVVRVAWRGQRITTHVPGPPVGIGRNARPVRAKLNIERTPDGVSLSIGSQRHELKPRRWSEWFTVSFKWGPVQVGNALVKFYLAEVEPQLRLFATPAQIDPRNQLSPITQPAEYGTELAEHIGPFYTLGLPEDTNAVTDGRYDLDGFLQQCIEIDRERRAMFEYELNRFDEGVLAVVFDSGDRIQHMFWSVDDVQSPSYDPARAKEYGYVVSDMYREMDRVLAQALDAAGDDMAIFVVSDHGFGHFRRAVHLNRWLVDTGLMKLKVQGEGGSLFTDVDWSQTRAYAVGFASVYLNLAGRESKGIVSQDEAESVARSIAQSLRETHDPESGSRFVRNAYVGQDVYAGAQVAAGPDIVVGFEPGYRASWQTALGGAPPSLVENNDKLWAADHLVDPSAVPGVLGTNVPVSGANYAGVDLAPTILNCLGVPVPSYMDGTSWLDNESCQTNVTREQTSDETLTPVSVGADASADDGLSDDERAALEQHLSDLGYL